MTPVVGTTLTPLVEEVSHRQIVMGPGATGDYFPGHWDLDYAHAQGQPTIYGNSMHVFGLLDRVALEWAGPTTFLVRRAVRLQQSLYAGSTVTVTGTVLAVRQDGLVDLEMAITNQDGGTICTASLTLRLQ